MANKPNAILQTFVNPRYFRILASYSIIDVGLEMALHRDRETSFGYTYRQEDITEIHTAENSISNTGEIRNVAGAYQQDGDDMMRQHGNMILSALFNVKAVDLLNPKCQLHQIVVLHVSRDQHMRIVNPVLRRAEPMRTMVHNVLHEKKLVSLASEMLSCKADHTNHASRTKDNIIGQNIALLCYSLPLGGLSNAEIA